MRNLLCVLGLHKWDIVKQWIVDGVAQKAKRCLRCPMVKKVK